MSFCPFFIRAFLPLFPVVSEEENKTGKHAVEKDP